MIFVKTDGTVIPLGREGLIERSPVNPNWAREIQVDVRRRLEE